MASLLQAPKRRAKSWLIDRLFTRSGDDYQRKHHSSDKYDLIVRNIDTTRVNNVLDVGCNEGMIASAFATAGKFAIGVDCAPSFLSHVLNGLEEVYGKRRGAAFGVFPLSEECVGQFPSFDLILLLSVHHQMVKRNGDEYTRRVVATLIDKASEYFVIEFAARGSKYGFQEAPFVDNDEASVVAYGRAWLESLGVAGRIEYVGKNREGSAAEPYRFLFVVRKRDV